MNSRNQHYNINDSSGVQYGSYNFRNVTMAQRQGHQEKIRKAKKPLSNSERQPGKEKIEIICERIVKCKKSAWMELGEKLGLTKGEVETVNYDYEKEGVYECCYQMLRRWKERQPTPYQIKVLAAALDAIGIGDLSDVLAY